MFGKFGEFGRIGEMLLEDWLKEQGYFVVPTSLIERGGAPLLEGHIKSHVLPDVLTCKDGASRWIDVKAKTSFTFNNSRRRWEDGIEARLWRDYQTVAEKTGIPGALAFVHVHDHKLYFADLEVLAETKHVWAWTEEWARGHPGHAFKESMVFFDRDRMERYDLTNKALLHHFDSASIPRATVRPWEQNREPPGHRQQSLFDHPIQNHPNRKA